MTKRTSYQLDLQEHLISPAQDYLRDDLFPTYCQLIAEYTVRKMTYSTDRLNGIGGFLSVLDCEGHMDFLHGLPKPLLEAAILWRPQQYLTRVPVDPITGMPQWPSWSWAGWIGGAEYDSEHDYNGREPLSSGSLRTRSITKMLCCYLNNSGDAKLRTDGTPPAPAHGLYIRTKTSRFTLTLEDLSGHLKQLPSLHRFGISYTSPVPARKDAGKYAQSGDEPWLGTIRLPSRYRGRLSEEFEFIVLSEAYTFSSKELVWSESQENELFLCST